MHTPPLWNRIVRRFLHVRLARNRILPILTEFSKYMYLLKKAFYYPFGNLAFAGPSEYKTRCRYFFVRQQQEDSIFTARCSVSINDKINRVVEHKVYI